MKKLDFTRILFFITSVIILLLGIFLPNSDFTSAIISALIIIALLVFDIKAPKIAKMSNENPKVKTMRQINRLTIFIVIVASLANLLKPIESIIYNENSSLLLVGVTSVVIMFIGNISPKIPFNRYMGLRLPWTIRDEDTWRISHRILGYISFPIAIIMFIASFFFDTEKVVATAILTWILIPGIYSLIFYYRKMKGLKA